jgi:glucose-6-phosphate 1-dehydrogenase
MQVEPDRDGGATTTDAAANAGTQPVADVLVLFGITGDLVRKLVLPALYRLAARRELTVPLVGVALTDLDATGLRRHVTSCVEQAVGDAVDRPALERLLARTRLVAADYAGRAVSTRLADTLTEAAGADALVVHYLAVPPSLFGTVADGIAAPGLANRSRLVVEKPFGHDLASARALDARLRRHYPEERIFRVDHLQISMAEDFDVADRGSFYDAVGTVRDVVQNHLLQMLAYVLMEPPLSQAADDQRDAKHRLLRAVRTVDPAEVVRGRYAGYLDTPGVAPGSTTETYVALTLHLDDWRWSGVPVHLRAGKYLPATLLDVVAVLRAPPGHPVRQRGRPARRPGASAAPARLRSDLPDPGQAARSRDRAGAGAGAGARGRRLPRGARPGPRRPRADLRRRAAGRRGHFARMDNLEECWRIVGPVLDGTGPAPYDRGSRGPDAAATPPGPPGWVELPAPTSER